MPILGFSIVARLIQSRKGSELVPPLCTFGTARDYSRALRFRRFRRQVRFRATFMATDRDGYYQDYVGAGFLCRWAVCNAR